MTIPAIRKAVIPAAGRGTRLEPLTLAIPKEMIRVGTKPVIEHVLEIVQAAAIREALVITGWKKGAILDYLGSGRRLGLDIFYKVQEEQLGLGHAILQAREWVGDDQFLVIYGDNYFKPARMITDVIAFHRQKQADITLVLHPVDDPRRFGIARFDRDGRVLGMVEKPSLEEAAAFKTNGRYYNIAGLVICSPKIFPVLEKTKPGRNSEIQFTDAIEAFRRSGGRVCGYVFTGQRFDIGTFESLLEADRMERSAQP